MVSEKASIKALKLAWCKNQLSKYPSLFFCQVLSSLSSWCLCGSLPAGPWGNVKGKTDADYITIIEKAGTSYTIGSSSSCRYKAATAYTLQIKELYYSYLLCAILLFLLYISCHHTGDTLSNLESIYIFSSFWGIIIRQPHCKKNLCIELQTCIVENASGAFCSHCQGHNNFPRFQETLKK